MKVVFFFLMLFFTAGKAITQITLKDRFGRSLSGQPITLVDWEGYIANPAIMLTLQAPAGTSFPLTVTLSANGSRLYFDLPSLVGSTGPAKTISLSNTNPASFFLSIFPDRDDGSETYTLTITSSLGLQTFSVFVFDEDLPQRSIDFPVLLDYSKDKPAYNFFAVQKHRDITRQAADDWAYFISDMRFDKVPANDEYTFIWDDEFATGSWTLNAQPYTGFLLYAYGAHDVQHRSGGAPSWHAFQKTGGIATRLRRSGGYNADPHGNYNTLGWDTTITDDTWYKATNGGEVKNDLYSIALHEIGHALCFNPGYPAFDEYKRNSSMTHPDVVAYQGSAVPISGADHLFNEGANNGFITDRLSKKGVFGSEYAGVMPYGRWLITKLNLLGLQAIGYSIKQTSAFTKPAVHTTSLPNGTKGQTYSALLDARGGIPFYRFDVVDGTLPAGLSMNSFTGAITGIATETGTASFTIRLTDYDEQSTSRSFSISITNNRYTFTGNGDWNNAANWANHAVPVLPLANGVEVIINPAPGGQCTFTGNLMMHPGATLKVQPGKIFKVNKE